MGMTMRPFHLSVRLFSEIFWEAVLQTSTQREPQRRQLLEQIEQLDGLRAGADYNTGSISAASAWCLYSVVRYFQVSRALEVGTFIGKSTWSMALAMDHEKIASGEIHTCDMSNSIDIPYVGTTRIAQYKKLSSTDMLNKLAGRFDFAHFDGRVTDSDLPLLQRLLAPDAIVALDDFEGMEKGVANLMNLRAAGLLQQHFLVYPCAPALLERIGFTDHSLTAILVPISLIQLTAQG
jgi:predicted O-methyltransferase YrrM